MRLIGGTQKKDPRTLSLGVSNLSDTTLRSETVLTLFSMQSREGHVSCSSPGTYLVA